MADKTSSKRKRRGDKVSSKKKSRRKESKKRRRRSYDSVSSSSDDDSLYLERRSPTSESDHRRRLTKTNKRRHDSPLSDSDSSSTDDKRHKKRKARRSRVDLKDVKRKRRKRSVSVDATGGRKRKRSAKDHAIRPIKKSSKKKSKRVLSSSSGSDSKSCSSSQNRSYSSSGDDSRRKNKVVTDRGRERLRRRGSSKGKKKHEDRSPSCTSIGRGADPSFSVGYSDEEHFPVDNSRRLRSVIIVLDRPRDEEDYRWGMDPHKEEIVYDQNDYPSPRSPDSNEGGNKMESGNQSNVAFGDRVSVENIAGEEVYELGKSRIGDGDHHHQSEDYMNKSEENEIGTSVPVNAPGGESLESILRQKALENLRKFRKMPQTSPRSNLVKRCNETNAATLSDAAVDIVESNSIEQGISNAEVNPISELRSQGEISEVVKLSDNEDVEKKPRMADHSIEPPTPSNGSALVECVEEDKSPCSPAVEAKAVSQNDTSPGAGVTKECSTSNIEPTPGEHSSGQAQDTSQFEKKTMTVMRGGELVQMSLAEDSPVHSSSSDDFAAILDAELDFASSDSSGGDSEEVVEEEESSDEDDDGRRDFGDLERAKRQKVELFTGTINPQSSSSQDAMSEETIVPLPEEEMCTHPGFFAGMCMKCGLRVDDDLAVPLKYIDKNLRLANDEMTRLRDKDFKDLLHRRKLYLVLDLDHTLLNSARLTDIKEEEAYLNSQRDALPDALKTSLFRIDKMHMMTKLRPFVHAFLEEASKLFEMYIYTMGERPYALEMADLLDPGNKYFHSRIIAQGDCTQKYQKGLDIVLGRESAVLILDDTEHVWKENKENLILMDRYHFFASSCSNFGFSYKSLSLLKTDESETEGALATVLKVLQQVHSLFFDKERKDNLENRDVRQVLKTVRKEVLKDCKIVFTRLIPKVNPAELHPLWRMAEQLGATCSTDVDPSVTHVVSGDAGTDKSRWAVKENKFLVNKGWIEASNFLWRKQPEENFLVSPAKCKQ